ncbi:PREDICTED: sepiapterin reductase-like [Rhagoletis zephyria]|uniref:sepiapterin reductase n=1 Tax=Rhagoletis zephyria TaxID=28612 RepID=UPI00081154ED|nr:PREDICTED: sepiapterin reductase [Rhagoletis zephyria]XP_017479939.1 PREDICTED: sepiapterin reductase-like [Rhagoletis zephyria]
MCSKSQDLSKRTFFILSGVSNALGRSLAIEMCRHYSADSLAILIDPSEENLQEVKKEIEYLERGINVVCWPIKVWQEANGTYFRQLLAAIFEKYTATKCEFELAFILHNEGKMATNNLMEPQLTEDWLSFVQENLYAPIALNRAFLSAPQLTKITKLVANITSSLMIRPFVYNSLLCSCMKARDMYFRSMANEEIRNDVNVISYSPGILETHKPQLDANNNEVDLSDLGVNEKWLQLPRVNARESSLKLINILQEMSFISGHDVDYYDTFNL